MKNGSTHRWLISIGFLLSLKLVFIAVILGIVSCKAFFGNFWQLRSKRVTETGSICQPNRKDWHGRFSSFTFANVVVIVIRTSLTEKSERPSVPSFLNNQELATEGRSFDLAHFFEPHDEGPACLVPGVQPLSGVLLAGPRPSHLLWHRQRREVHVRDQALRQPAQLGVVRSSLRVQRVSPRS